MTTLNAGVFLALGGMLNLLTLVAPGLFPPNGLDGANTSALWLQFMGWVSGGLGAGYLVRLQVLPVLVRAPGWRPPLPPELRPAFVPAGILRPALGLGEEFGPNTGERRAAA